MADTEATRNPERVMARQAAVPAIVVSCAAFVVGLLANGIPAAVSAALGVAVVAGSFSAYVLVLGWARSTSLGLLQGVVLGGWLLRLGVFVGMLFGLRAVGWFDVAAFGLAGVAAALAVAVYEARLWFRGLGSEGAQRGEGRPATGRMGRGA